MKMPHEIEPNPFQIPTDTTDNTLETAIRNAKFRTAVMTLGQTRGFEACLALVESVDPSSLSDEQRMMLATMSLQHMRLKLCGCASGSDAVETKVENYINRPRFVVVPDDPGIIEFGFANGQVSLRE